LFVGRNGHKLVHSSQNDNITNKHILFKCTVYSHKYIVRVEITSVLVIQRGRIDDIHGDERFGWPSIVHDETVTKVEEIVRTDQCSTLDNHNGYFSLTSLENFWVNRDRNVGIQKVVCKVGTENIHTWTPTKSCSRRSRMILL